ncbi:MAG: aminodeoxychorismate lyase [Bilifractor sp.]|jgi:cell division protein YceG involved in septum cleavage
MAEEEHKKSALDIALSGVKGITKFLGLILLVIALIVIGHEAYKLGYNVLYQVPVDEGEGREIKVTITDDMSVREIGEMLKNAGLLEENPTVFVLQERISDYHDKIIPGTYTLSTSMTADEMLRVMAGESEDEEDSSGTQETVSSSSGSSPTEGNEGDN